MASSPVEESILRFSKKKKNLIIQILVSFVVVSFGK